MGCNTSQEIPNFNPQAANGGNGERTEQDELAELLADETGEGKSSGRLAREKVNCLL